MKRAPKLSRRPFETSVLPPRRLAIIERDVEFPPPDPSTRVELHIASSAAARPRGGELIVAAGLGAILLSASSKFVQLIELPSVSELSVAALGAALAVLGLLKHKGWRPMPAALEQDDAPRPAEVDLPSLTGQLSALLAQLRQQHGVAYRTRTWIEVVLPGAGAELDDPTLARNLLAAAALDAGGIRADVGGLVESHSRDEIVATMSVLIAAVESVLDGCAQPTDQHAPPASDSSCWPASAC